MDDCCEKSPTGMLRCVMPEGICEPPPDVCTGDPKVDAVLKRSDLGCHIGLTKYNKTYTWKGFCEAYRIFNGMDSKRKLHTGFGGDDTCKFALGNIVALLGQAMWESGGEAPFTACDENNYTNLDTAACTQREDGELYHTLIDKKWHCPVKKDMHMTAVTKAFWVTKGPMECKPGTVTEGCCWWGRGAIQTTGPNNYGKLNKEVIKKVQKFVDLKIDLCENPEAICQHEDMKWIGAMFYWANDVQGFEWPDQKKTFEASFKKYVESGFDRT